MAEIVQAAEFHGPGERRTAVYLQKNLPDDWLVVCGKELLSHTGAQEIDFIIVADHTVFAVEEKYWKGEILGNENGWVHRGESQSSPMGQAGMAARRLAGMLRDHISYLRDARVGHFVFPRVILSHPEVDPHIDDPRAAEEVLVLERCERALLSFDRAREGFGSIAPFKADIRRALTRLPTRPAIPERIRDFTILESLRPDRFIRVFRAQHEDGSERILKLVKKPGALDEHDFETEKAALLREYEVLRDLAPTGRVPEVDPYFTWEEDYWVLPTYQLDATTLRADRAREVPGEERVTAVVVDAAKALAEVHEHAIIHRTLSPDRIALDSDDRVRFTDFHIARITGAATIVQQVEPLVTDDPYRAPECRLDLGLAEPQSDVYGLAASLHFWVTGHVPEDDEAPDFPAVSALRSDLPSELTAALDSAFSSSLQVDERSRPTAAELRDQLIRDLAPAPAPESEPEPSEPDFGPGSMIDNQHRIVRMLGAGATATTFLAEDTASDEQVVLKVIRNPELASRLSRTEFGVLRKLSHPNLPRVWDIRPPDSPFHIKMDYVRGVPLNEVRGQFQGKIEDTLEVMQQVLDALDHLETNGLIHRDIAPGNVLVPTEADEQVKLIDFGLAALNEDASTTVGTPLYRAPEVDGGGHWTPQSDLYSVAVLTYELIAGRLPYELEDGRPRKSQLRSLDVASADIGNEQLARVLLRACATDREQRFLSASELGDALNRALTERPVEGTGDEARINPFVDELRSAYRNTTIGNADNRGLDSRFARETYIQTRLDTDLLPQLLEGNLRLVILSGNPGDGKTAFLQQLEDALVDAGASATVKNEAGWRYELEGHRFHAVYDASESHGELSADDLLHDALDPLEEGEDGRYTAAIAANDGRLLEFFERHGVTYGSVWPALRAQLEGGTGDRDDVVLVDLKRRSLAALDPRSESLFTRVLDSFVGPDRWDVCGGCVANRDCPMVSNAQSLRDGALAESARAELQRMVLAVHLRKERRPTVRDLRSALSYVITNDRSCEDVHATREQGESGLGDQRSMYFNAVFGPRPDEDLLLDEWMELDPAIVSTPRLDRHLFFHRGEQHTHVLRPMLLPETNRPTIGLAVPSLDDSSWLAHIKRRYAFEADEAAVEERDLATPSSLLPYRFFEDFLKALRGEDHERFLGRLLRGLSIADGAPPSSIEDVLALSATPTESRELQVVKRFPRAEFRLRHPRETGGFAEAIPDELVLEHISGHPHLAVTLDIFEFLNRCAEGSTASSREQRALLEDIILFKEQLLGRHTEEVLIVEGGRRHHQVRVNDHTLVREQGVGA